MQRITAILATLAYLAIAVGAGLGLKFISTSKAESAEMDARDRLVRGERTLQDSWKSASTQRKTALRHTIGEHDVQAALVSLTSLDISDVNQAKRFLDIIRVPFATTLAKDAMEILTEDDLILVKTKAGLFWANKDLASSARTGEVLNAGFGDLDEIAASTDLHYGYLKAESGSVAFIISAEAISLPGEGDLPPKVIVAVARRLSNDLASKSATTIGVDVSVVAADSTAASSLENTVERKYIAGISPQSCPSLGAGLQNASVSLERLPEIHGFPVKIPVFVTNASSHLGCSIEVEGLAAGGVILSTRMDGIIELAELQTKAIPGYLAFLLLGLFGIGFVWSIKGSSKNNQQPETTIRKVPIAGQTLNIAASMTPSGGTPAVSADVLQQKNAVLTPAPVVDPVVAPGMSPVPPIPAEAPVAAELSPDDFNFGDSPIAGSENEPASGEMEAMGLDPAVSAPPSNVQSTTETDEENALASAMLAAYGVGESSDASSAESGGDAPLFDSSSAAGTLIDDSYAGGTEVQPVATESAEPEELSPAAVEAVDEPAQPITGGTVGFPQEEAPADGGDDLFAEVANDASAALDALFPGQEFSDSGQGFEGMEGGGYYDPSSPEALYAAQAMDPNAVYDQGYGESGAGEMAAADPSMYGDPAAYGDGQVPAGDYYGQAAMDADPSAYANDQAGYGDDGYAMADSDESHFVETYQAFVELRAQCGESGEVDYGQFIEKLRTNRDQVMQRYGSSSVRFEAYIKNGKASLKAVPIM